MLKEAKFSSESEEQQSLAYVRTDSLRSQMTNNFVYANFKSPPISYNLIAFLAYI